MNLHSALPLIAYKSSKSRKPFSVFYFFLFSGHGCRKSQQEPCISSFMMIRGGSVVKRYQSKQSLLNIQFHLKFELPQEHRFTDLLTDGSGNEPLTGFTVVFVAWVAGQNILK